LPAIQTAVAAGNIKLGQVWLPFTREQEIALSGEAGLAVRAVLLDVQRGVLASHRSLERSPIIEIAYFLWRQLVDVMEAF